MIELLQYVSIGIEALIVLFALLIGYKKGKKYGYGIALTFAIYVFYDLTKVIPLTIPNEVLYPIFFVGTLSILWAVWTMYKE